MQAGSASNLNNCACLVWQVCELGASDDLREFVAFKPGIPIGLIVPLCSILLTKLGRLFLLGDKI